MSLEQLWDDTNPGDQVHREVQEQLHIAFTNSVLQFPLNIFPLKQFGA